MRTVALIAALGVLPTTVAAQQLARVDSVVAALMKVHEVPGLALAVVRGDSLLLLRGWGVSRVSDSARVDPSRTLFRTASVAKLFVATAVMQERDAGRVRMDEDVNRYLAWKVPDAWNAPLTLAHLLTHTAGFDERMIGYAAPAVDSIGDLGAHLASNLPNRGWPPGRVIGYSNYGVALAAHVVERTSGLPFDRYARQRIFEPLGMHHTWYMRVPDSLRADVAQGHRGCHPCEPAPVVFTRPYPVGFAYSTAADMARFMSAQLGGRTRVLSDSSLADMQRQHHTADSAVLGMSYGWFNQVHRGHRVLAHGGNVPGVNNLLLIVPQQRLGVYFVTNGGRTLFGTHLRDSLLAMLLPEASRQTATAPARLSEEYVRSLAGKYQMTRYAHRTIEKFPSLFATSVDVRARGTRLVLPYPDGALEFEAVDSLRFREVNGDRMIAFVRDERGAPRLLAAPVPVFGAELPATLERLAWHDGAYFMNEYVSWLLLGPAIVLALFGIATLVAWWRRRRATALPIAANAGRRPAVAIVAAIAFVGLWIWFGFGFVARSARMFGSASGLTYGLTPNWQALAMIPFVMAAIAALITALVVLSWRRRWWDAGRRTLMTLFVVGAIATIAFLVRWNYLPATF